VIRACVRVSQFSVGVFFRVFFFLCVGVRPEISGE